ncbi:hypothetical protein OIO90_000100 [Microbotryomycetes sp. JL221]|nr:hypothetical protein OIO90_000100 [Microbotryomycetes sp. JL221]
MTQQDESDVRKASPHRSVSHLTGASTELFMSIVADRKRLHKDLQQRDLIGAGSPQQVAEARAYTDQLEKERDSLKSRLDLAELEAKAAVRKATRADERIQELESLHRDAIKNENEVAQDLDAARAKLKDTEVMLDELLESRAAVNHAPEANKTPVVLVLIDGTNAPFAAGLLGQGAQGGAAAARQLLWEANKTLNAKASDAHKSSEDNALIACFVFYSGATWEAFMLSFNAVGACSMIECPSENTPRKATALIRFFTKTNSLRRIVVAGISPSLLAAAAEDEATAISQAVKMVVVSHLETQAESDAIQQLGYPVTQFTRLFSTDERVATSFIPVSEQNSNDSQEESDDTDEYWLRPVRSIKSGDRKMTQQGPTTGRLRKINPNKGFLHQEPQIEEGCFSGKKCVRAHDYDLNERQLKHFASDISRVGCKELRKTGHCTWKMKHGSACMFRVQGVGSAEQDATKWRKLILQQNELVASLLSDKQKLTQALAIQMSASRSLLPAPVQPPAPTVASRTTIAQPTIDQQTLDQIKGFLESADQDRQVLKQKLEAEQEETRKAIKESETFQLKVLTLEQEVTQTQKQLEEAQARLVSTQEQAEHIKKTKFKKSQRRPYILVLIDGSSAVFSEVFLSDGGRGGRAAAAQLIEEIEEDIRACPTENYGSLAAESEQVVSYLFYDGDALVPNLIRTGAVKSEADWTGFVTGFSAFGSAYAIDIGSTPAETKIAQLIKLHETDDALARVYVIGLNPASLIKELPSLDKTKQTGSNWLGSQMAAKIAAFRVNHRESSSDGNALKEAGWRVATFSRLFAPDLGLARDWGLQVPSSSKSIIDGLSTSQDDSPTYTSDEDDSDDDDEDDVAGYSVNTKSNAGSINSGSWKNANEIGPSKKKQKARAWFLLQQSVQAAAASNNKIEKKSQSPKGAGGVGLVRSGTLHPNPSRSMLGQDELSHQQEAQLRKEVSKLPCRASHFCEWHRLGQYEADKQNCRILLSVASVPGTNVMRIRK